MTQYTKCLLGRGCELPCQKPCNAGPGSAHLYSSVPKGIRETGLTNLIKHMSQIVWIMEAESKRKRKKERKNRKGERKIDRRDFGKEPEILPHTRWGPTSEIVLWLQIFIVSFLCPWHTHTYIHTSGITHTHMFISHIYNIFTSHVSLTHTHTHWKEGSCQWELSLKSAKFLSYLANWHRDQMLPIAHCLQILPWLTTNLFIYW